MSTDDLILEIQSLPEEEQARVADCILRSLNQTVSEVDQKWVDLAGRRLQAIQTGAIKPVAGEEVLLRYGVGLIDADSLPSSRSSGAYLRHQYLRGQPTKPWLPIRT